jgi:hypothetical protein
MNIETKLINGDKMTEIQIQVVAPSEPIAKAWVQKRNADVKNCTFYGKVRRWHDNIFGQDQRTDLGCLQDVYKMTVDGGDEEEPFEENAMYIPNRSEIVLLGGERIA